MDPVLSRYYHRRHERYLALLGWRGRVPELLGAVRQVLPGAKVFIFGSALRNELVADSDVDALIVTPRSMGAGERGEVSLAIEDRLSPPIIFELHLTDPKGLEYYRRHAKELTPLDDAAPSARGGVR